MFWMFLIVLVVAVSFLKLGALSVWMSVAWFVFRVLLVFSGLFLVHYLWRRLRSA